MNDQAFSSISGRAESDNAPAPIIVGAPRSGTTLLRLMLDANSQLAIPPETGFLGLRMSEHSNPRNQFFDALTNYPIDAPAWSDYGITQEAFWEGLQNIEPFEFGAGARCFFRLYAVLHGKRRWGDKTPGHIFQMPTIEQRLPEAHFIHVIRDGRDVALSWRPLWFAPSQSMSELADHWSNWVRTGRRLGSRCRHYTEVRFEELVTDPEPVLQSLCQFLELDYQPAMLEFHIRAVSRLEEHRERRSHDGQIVVRKEQRLRQQERTMQPPMAARAGNWKQSMSPVESTAFLQQAASLLDELGYET